MPKSVRRSMAELRARQENDGQVDSAVSDFLNSMKKKRSSSRDQAAVGLDEIGVIRGKHSPGLTNQKPRSAKNSSNDLRRLQEGDVDNIYRLVKQVKQSGDGQDLLKDFVQKQAGAKRTGISRSKSSDPEGPPVGEIIIA